VRIRFAFLISLLPLALAGCANTPTASSSSNAATSVAFEGTVHGGMTPLAGARIYMLGANITGYGQPSVSLLDPAATGSTDSIGAYVTSDSSGHFNVPTGFNCTSSTQAYLYVVGGNAGGGVNSGAGMMAVLGACPSEESSAPPTLVVNEISTVAAAYAIAGFAADPIHVSSSGTPSPTSAISTPPPTARHSTPPRPATVRFRAVRSTRSPTFWPPAFSPPDRPRRRAPRCSPTRPQPAEPRPPIPPPPR